MEKHKKNIEELINKKVLPVMYEYIEVKHSANNDKTKNISKKYANVSQFNTAVYQIDCKYKPVSNILNLND